MTRQIDRSALAEVRAREESLYHQRTQQSEALRTRAMGSLPGGVPMAWMNTLYESPPVFVAHGAGASFTDVDGNSYLDFNLCDLSMTVGYGAEPIIAAAAEATTRGTHFLLPIAEAAEVSETLADRVGLPYWQFTLSASGANTEVIRIARALTGRTKIIVFHGHYHGSIDETLVGQGDNGTAEAAGLGLRDTASKDTVILPFNDTAALKSQLAEGDVALVVTEPALTNCTLVHPADGFHAELRELTREHGTLLCYDEAHTFQFAYGGLTRAWQLASDFVVLGKGLGSGISFAVYGMTEPIAAFCSAHSILGPDGLPIGGTTYGSTMAILAARAVLNELLTPSAHDRIALLGERLASGLDTIFAQHDLPWTAQRLGPRSGFCLYPTLPTTGAEGSASIDTQLIAARRIYGANRGIFDAIESAGPQVTLAHNESDVDHYVSCTSSFLDEVTS